MKKYLRTGGIIFVLLSAWVLTCGGPGLYAQAENKREPREVIKHGLDALKIQEALKAAGVYDGSIDGIFGKKTREAIRKFQESHDLKPDGICGPQTWEKLKSYSADALEAEPLDPGPSVSDDFYDVDWDLSSGYSSDLSSGSQDEDLRKKLIS